MDQQLVIFKLANESLFRLTLITLHFDAKTPVF